MPYIIAEPCIGVKDKSCTARRTGNQVTVTTSQPLPSARVQIGRSGPITEWPDTATPLTVTLEA